MSIGRSKEEQQLNDMLVKGLVQREVIEPMEANGWRQGAAPTPEQVALYQAERGRADGATEEQIAAFLAERGVKYIPPAGGQPVPAEGAPGQAAKTPPASAPAGQPVPPDKAAPADKSDANGPTAEDGLAVIAMYEALRDPKTGLIGGKYKTVAEAIKGSGHLANMTKQTMRENAELKARLSAAPAPSTPPGVAPAPATQPTPVASPSRAKLDEAQARLDKVLSDIAENGGILDEKSAKAMSKAQREVADLAAEVRVEEDRNRTQQVQSADKAAWDAVDSYMKEHHPDAERFSEEVALNIESDPLLASAVNALMSQGKRTEATELAWLAYKRIMDSNMSAEDRAKAEKVESDLAAREQVRNEQRAQALKDAGVVTGSAGGAGAHENKNAAGASREEIAAARDAMRREGDAPGSPAAMRFRQMVIGPSLDPRIFGPGN